MAYAIVLAVLVFILLMIVLSSVKVIRPYQRGLVERLGRYHATVEPGLRIDPPPDVVTAMHHQMQAERTRRAVVTEAQGSREASITRAEGEKQAAILEAEGQKQSQILAAEGEAEATMAVAKAERFRQLTVAEGEAEAVKKVYTAIHEGKPTADLLAVKYLEALEVIANGKATKIFLPTEATALLGARGGMSELLAGSPPNGAKPPTRRTRTST